MPKMFWLESVIQLINRYWISTTKSPRYLLNRAFHPLSNLGSGRFLLVTEGKFVAVILFSMALCLTLSLFHPTPTLSLCLQLPGVETLIAAKPSAGGNKTPSLEGKPSHSDDLFSAHNFDITINLNIPTPGTGNV